MAPGFTEADYDLEPLWPENWAAWHLFCEVSTQWRTDFNGVVGLDYGPLMALLNQRGLKPDDWQALFQDVRVLEQEAMEQMKKNSASS